jgi:hypothetical protein
LESKSSQNVEGYGAPLALPAKGLFPFCWQLAPTGNDLKSGNAVCGYVAVEDGEGEGSFLDQGSISSDEASRARYLERENARLQRLVAELLARNEELRQRYLASLAAGD